MLFDAVGRELAVDDHSLSLLGQSMIRNPSFSSKKHLLLLHNWQQICQTLNRILLLAEKKSRGKEKGKM